MPDEETARSGSVQPAAPDHVQDPSAAAPPGQSGRSGRSGNRVLGPDLLRGVLMILQAIDHCALSVGAWEHGVARLPEADGLPQFEWNEPVAYTARMLTHLCAPGFMFLMGMGIVYFGRSRRKLGWSALQLTQHVALRALALFAVNQLFITLPAALGRNWIVNSTVWIINSVLVSLAVNYLLAGLLWLGLGALENVLVRRWATADPEREPLLAASARPPTIPWHVHNAILAALVAITAWWNILLSPNGGHCTAGTGTPLLDIAHNGPLDFWFYVVINKYVISGFPPLAWLSFAILGLLYGRIVNGRPWQKSNLAAFNAVAALAFFTLFVLTRLLRFGNLSEDCLRFPEQLAHPDRNPYLASVRSFFYVVKYPPSMSFFALTMSGNFLVLALFSLASHIRLPLKPLVVYGTSALFFYAIHMLLYPAIGVIAKKLFGHPTAGEDPLTGEPQIGVGDGPVMWVCWLLGLALLYPLCDAYGRFKSRRSPDSVWRFF